MDSELACKAAEEIAKEQGLTRGVSQALDLVLQGGVDTNKMQVKSGGKTYEVHPLAGCKCPAITEYCKHFIAMLIQCRAEERNVPKSTPQDDWEAKVQNPEEASALDLFPDDIPEPAPPKPPELETHYVNHPSTISIKRMIGSTECLITLRDALDMANWNRASNMIKLLDDLATKHAERRAAAAPADGDEGHYCQEHQVYFSHNRNERGEWWSHRKADGSWCNERAQKRG